MSAVVALISLDEPLDLSKKVRTQLWRNFKEGKRSMHSNLGRTLEYLIKRAQREGVPFTLTVYPNEWFTMQRFDTAGGTK